MYRCGICGDAWNASPAEHEAPGGKFANGILVAHYQPGQDIDVTVLVTANHKVTAAALIVLISNCANSASFNFQDQFPQSENH